MGSTVIRLVTMTTVVTLVALGGLALPVAAEEACDPACVGDPGQTPPEVNHPVPDNWYPTPDNWIPQPDNWEPDPPKAHPMPDDWWPEPDVWAPGHDR